MSDGFIEICGSCFNIIRNDNGYVLNCGDFLCSKCASHITTCSLCQKENISKLPLSSTEKPDDVMIRISSTTLLMENLHSAIQFQSKSYVRIIRALCIERAELLK